MKNNFMTEKNVIDLYNSLSGAGIKIWIDGGFCVDALLEKQLRPHKDLDIAIQWKDVSKLKEILTKQNYKQIREDSQWNFVLGNDKEYEIDVHAFVFDNEGNIVDGIMYPKESLTGNGIIENQSVSCISPKYMVEFLTPWISKWPEKYLPAISEICEKYSIELPKEYGEYKEKNNL
jgi:lincosamide nucleotidyltransferase A/C/D/E